MILPLLVIGSFLFLSSFSPLENKAIQSFFPLEYVQSIHKINQGCANDVWIIKTNDLQYVIRIQQQKIASEEFDQILYAFQLASHHQLGPQLISYNTEQQSLLLEYIESIPWPTYENDPLPYHETVRTLNQFHLKMPKKQTQTFAPFSLIFEQAKEIEKQMGHEKLPHHFFKALKVAEKIDQELQPWLQEHAVLCHGDFHLGNVLLKTVTPLEPYLIDFDSITMGHPFFDFVKFTLFLKQDQRLALLSTYLGGRSPSLNELDHLEKMDLTIRLLVTTTRWKSVNDAMIHSDDLLTKSEMQALLDQEEPLPSFLSIAFENPSLKQRQLGGLYALHEFLRRVPF